MTDFLLTAESIVFDCPSWNDKPVLKMVANRYTSASSEVGGLTLFFTHCIGGHKELWEPTIKRIFSLQSNKDRAHRIREAIAFDWQNHGDSAVLNEEALKSRPEGISAYELAPAIAYFVKTYLRGHRIVAIGHSAGAGTVMLTTKEFPIDPSPYVAMILVEPTLITKKLYAAHAKDRDDATAMRVKMTAARRDTWKSKEAAFNWLISKSPWKSWDPRVVKLYTEHGLRAIPPPEGSHDSSGVTLKCNKMQESIAYPDVAAHWEATAQFARVCRSLPVHVIFGSKDDFVLSFVKKALSDGSEGRFAASVSRVPDAGHMVVQEQPDMLGDRISCLLDSIEESPVLQSRL